MMTLYFLGVVTGTVSSLLIKDRLSSNFVLDGEDETGKSRVVPSFVEEDVICHSNYFTIVSFAMFSPLNSTYNSSGTMEASISMVAPPPERA